MKGLVRPVLAMRIRPVITPASLMLRADHTVSIEELNQRVWGYASEADNTMLKNVVYRLRRKIESDPSDPQFVQTVVGAGYRLASGMVPAAKAEDEA